MHLWCMVFRQSSKFISHFLLDQGEKRQYDTEVIWGLDDPGTDRNHYFSLSSRPLKVNQTELLATWSPASPHKVWFLCWEVPRVHCFCQWCWAVNRWLSLIDGGCSRWLLLPGVGKVWLNHWWRSQHYCYESLPLLSAGTPCFGNWSRNNSHGSEGLYT